MIAFTSGVWCCFYISLTGC